MQHRFSSLLAFGFALALSGGFASVAQAGPVEQLVQVSLHPKDPDIMALRHEYGGEGLFITKDRGKSWTYVCNTFIDPSTNARRGMLQVAPDGSLLLGVFDGVWHGDAKGCGWALDEALLKKWVPDITPDPIDPDVLYAVTSNGDPGLVNGIVRRDASGAWSDLGEKQEMLLTRLRVVKNGDALRFYESAVKGTLKAIVNGMEIDVANYLVRVSDDDGATFEEFSFTAPEMGSFKLLAVDPTNPDRVVAWIDRDASGQHDDSVLVSTNKGESFTEYTTVTDLGGMVIAPDGRVWIAERGSTTAPDASRGLWSAPSLDVAPTKLASDQPLSCLAFQPEGEVLYACQLRKFGTIDLDTGAFSELFSFNKVGNFAQCDGAEPMSAACEPQLCRDYCALGHFPETPMCVAYQTSTCGPCAAMPTAEGCTLDPNMLPGAGQGGAGGGGAGMSGSTGGSGGAAGGSAGAPAPPSAGRAGTGAPPKGSDDDDTGDGGDSGCSVGSAGAGGGALAAPLLLLGLAMVLRRRRRACVRT